MFAPFFCALRNVLSHTVSVFLCAAGQRLKSRKNVLEDIGEPQKHILHFIDNDACVDNIVSKFVMKNTKYMSFQFGIQLTRYYTYVLYNVHICLILKYYF